MSDGVNVGTVVSTMIGTLRDFKGFSSWWDRIEPGNQRDIIDQLMTETAEAIEGKVTDDDPYEWVAEEEDDA